MGPETLVSWRSTHSSHNNKKSKSLSIFWKNGSKKGFTNPYIHAPFCSQLLLKIFVHYSCAQFLVTTSDEKLFSLMYFYFVQKNLSQIFFKKIVCNFCSQILFTSFIHNFWSTTLAHKICWKLLSQPQHNFNSTKPTLTLVGFDTKMGLII